MAQLGLGVRLNYDYSIIRVRDHQKCLPAALQFRRTSSLKKIKNEALTCEYHIVSYNQALSYFGFNTKIR
jgi:hypothetical protein